MTRTPVVVSLESLRAGTVPFATLQEAFGPDSLGIILVKDLPEEYVRLRQELLSYASFLANLPEEELLKIEFPEAHWNVGWSCGKEKLNNGLYDTMKGSFYANWRFEKEPEIQPSVAARYPTFPSFTSPNAWPREELLPGFRKTYREFCGLMVDTAALVARACDQYAASNIDGYRKGFLEHIVHTSTTTKSRLLHYFPPATDSSVPAQPDVADEDSEDGQIDDSWCGAHIDTGCLTGLTSAMFVNESLHQPTGAFKPLPGLTYAPDPRAGLYILSRSKEVTKVNIPQDCLAFQTGEALEVITAGRFKAVPHFVRSPKMLGTDRVARNTFAVFNQPNLWDMLDDKRDFGMFAKEITERNH